jgi:hypothetical protein
MNATKQIFLGCICVLASISAHAQFTSSVITDSSGLMWANTLGTHLGESVDGSPQPDSAQAWVASLNAENYGGYSDWTLPTADIFSSPVGNSTTNQLGQLFFNDCSNTGGPVINCGPFTAVQAAIDATHTSPNPFIEILSSTIFPSPPLLSGIPDPIFSFGMYLMDRNEETIATTDTSFGGFTGEGDEVAVRHVTPANAPEIDPRSLGSALTLLMGCVMVMRGSRVVYRKAA